jgi:hypothetical protein
LCDFLEVIDDFIEFADLNNDGYLNYPEYVKAIALSEDNKKDNNNNNLEEVAKVEDHKHNAVENEEEEEKEEKDDEEEEDYHEDHNEIGENHMDDL